MNEHTQLEQETGNTRSGTPSLLKKALHSRLFSDNVLFSLLIGLAFLLPIFFLPGTSIAPDFAKTILLEVVVLFGIFAYAAGRLRDGHFAIPKSLLLGAMFLLLMQFIVSAVAAPTPTVAFFGSGYDIGTVSTFAVLCLLLFLSAVVFRTRDRVLYLFAALLLSFSLVMVYHLLRHLLGYPQFLSFGSMTGPTSTPVGKWNDFATMAGAGAILSLLALYFFSAHRLIRVFSWAFFFVSLFFLLLVDFTVLWMILFVFSGGLIALALYEGELTHRRRHDAEQSADGAAPYKAPALPRRLVGHLPALAVVLLIISFVYGSGLAARPFDASGRSLSGLTALYLKATPYSEVVLTRGLTTNIIGVAIKESPLLGVGPNLFDRLYLLNKSSDINMSPFWDTAFEAGAGRLPTLFAMTGATGVLLWVIFLGLLFWKGRKVYALLAKDRVAAFIGIVLFFATLYFWSVAFFYLPNIAIFSYAFLCTGALVAFLASEGMIGTLHVDFASRKTLGFVVTPIIAVIMIGAVATGVLLFRQGAAIVSFAAAQDAVTRGDIAAAKELADRANAFAERDAHWRFLTSVSLAKLQQTISDGSMTPDARLTAANNHIVDARMAAERAVAIDPTNFENYLATGGFYDSLGSAGVGNALPSATTEYKKALALNPKSPRVLFLLGRVELLQNNKEGAREYLTRALTERPNYIEALSILAQMEIADKHPEKAIALVQNAVVVDPANFVLRFTLGYLQYSVRDYGAAISSLEAAVILNPVYANAKYFLGLSYARVGRPSDALLQFQDVSTLNPDNKDVLQIIANLRAGRDPLAPNIVPPEPTDILESSGGEEDN